MKDEKQAIHAHGRVKWKNPTELNRYMPLGVEKFAATARIVTEEGNSLFSIVLCFPESRPQEAEIISNVRLHFLSPELVLPKISIGEKLFLTDGPKVIAEVKIDEIFS